MAEEEEVLVGPVSPGSQGVPLWQCSHFSILSGKSLPLHEQCQILSKGTVGKIIIIILFFTCKEQKDGVLMSSSPKAVL